MAEARQFPFLTESYEDQKKHWPRSGKHILAQYDDRSVVVYQAFKPTIAEYAVKHQRFGGQDFSFDRMSWIKTNFLWMMYRCGWASKKGQERVLAVHITLDGFNQILGSAYSAKFQKSRNVSTDNIEVRLQWDPDHSPSYEKLDRRAIQLGLKGQTLKKYATEWVLHIEDITDFVKEQKRIWDEKRGNILTAKERVYPVSDQNIASRIDLDYYEEPTVVGFVS